MKGFDDSIHQKTLIFTNSDSTSSTIACNLYAKFKSKPLLFALKQFESPTEEEHAKNEKLVDRFNTNSKTIGVANFEVLQQTEFSFAKHFMFFDFPLKWHKFLDVLEKIRMDSKKSEMSVKITVFEAGMTAVQKISFSHALQNAGESLPKSLEKFVIENSTTSQPMKTQQAAVPIFSNSKKNSTADSNEDKLIIMAKDLSFGNFNWKLTEDDFNCFHNMKPEEIRTFHNSVTDEIWDQILKTNKEINHFRHESKNTSIMIRKIIKDVRNQIDVQERLWEDELNTRYVMIILFKQVHILSMNTDNNIKKPCIFCGSKNHFSLCCVYYPTLEMRQFRCKQLGICNYCGWFIKYDFDHQCPEYLECYSCGKNGHVQAIGHAHQDW